MKPQNTKMKIPAETSEQPQEDIVSVAAPLAERLVDTESSPKLDDIIAKIDEQRGEHEGSSLAQLWEYREKVRATYGLPESGYRWDDPSGYIQVMEDLLGKEGVDIRGKHEFAGFFNDNPTAGAVTLGARAFRDTTVVTSTPSLNDWWGLRRKANHLAHEGVHGLQDKRYPRMPYDVAEREAYYYQMLTPQRIMEAANDPESIFRYITDSIEPSIASSVATDEQLNP